MAAYFQLLSKIDGKAVDFLDLDVAICKHIGIEASETEWAYDWYGAIGQRVAISGKSIDQIREQFQGYITDGNHPEHYRILIQILDFIAERYTTDAWHSK